MRTTIGAVIALATTLSLAAATKAVGASTQGQAAPDLTGTWVLNTELSDKPPSAPSEGRGGDRGGRGRPGGGGGGMGGFSGGMGGGRGGGMGGPGEGGTPNREEMERMRAVMEAVMRPPTRLILVKSESGLVQTDEEGVSLRIPLDGTKDTGAVNGLPFETTAKWEEGRLRLERKFKSGAKLVEQYSLSAEGRQLTIASKVEGGRMPEGSRTIKRTYDRREQP
jgi:hypothetical protein